MRKLLLFVLPLSVLGSWCLAAQESGTQRFAGTWEAKFKDKVVCSIKLEAGETISGAMHACKINVDADGELIAPPDSEDAEDRPSPILDPKIQGDTLAFGLNDEGDEQALKVELALTGGRQAVLRFVNPPSPIKPIRFEKK